MNLIEGIKNTSVAKSSKLNNNETVNPNLSLIFMKNIKPRLFLITLLASQLENELKPCKGIYEQNSTVKKYPCR